MKRTYSRNYNNGHFASRDVLSKRMRKEELKGKIIAFTVVFACIVVFLVGLHRIAVWGRTEAHRAWERVVSWQVELRETAEYIAWRDIPIAHASEPLPFVPEVLKSKQDYQWYLGTLVHGALYEEIVKVIDCETAGTWSADIQSRWRYKHGKMKNRQELSFGLSQIHLPAHPNVTREEATDPKFALQFIAENYPKHPEWWSCYALLKKQNKI